MDNQRDFFLPALMISGLVHVGLFAAGSIRTQVPAFAVKHAPTSMEIVLVKAPPLAEDAEAGNIAQEKAQGFLKETARSSTDEPIASARREETVQKASSAQAGANLLQGALSSAQPQQALNAAPVYPQLARRRGWEGTVFLNVLVESSGRAGRVSVAQSSGHKILDDSALAAVEGWHFQPAKTAGAVAMSSWVTVPVQFVLVAEKEP